MDLDARPYDRWQEVGRRNKAKLGRFLRDIEAMCHDHAHRLADAAPREWLPDILKPFSRSILKPLRSGGSRLAGRFAATVARSFGEDYTAEIRGLAHASGLPESKLFLANLTYDLSMAGELWQAKKRRFFGACSSLSVAVAGPPVLVRNMDWALPESTGRFTVMTRFHKGGASYVNIAPLGCVGVLSAMRAGAAPDPQGV